MHNNKKNFILFILCFIIFLDFLGYGIILPTIVPILFSNEFHLLPDNLGYQIKYLILSFILSIFPIGQFLGGFFIGGLADKYGRKKTLTLTLTGTIIGYSTFLIGFLFENVFVLIIGRAISGFMSGNVALANTIISDISTTKENSKNFSFIGLSIGLGIVLGPFIGSKLSNPNEYINILGIPSFLAPYYLSVLLAIIGFILVLIFIPETFHPKVKFNENTSFKKELKNFMFNLTKSKIKYIFLSSFFLFLIFNIFVYTLNIYLYDELKFDTNKIGNFLTYTGISLIISMGFITPLISKYFKPYQILKISLFGLILILVITIFTLNGTNIYIITPLFVVFYGISYTNIAGLISTLSQDNKKGESFGANQSLQAFAEGIAPIIATNTFYLNTQMPFIIISFMSILSWLILVNAIKKLI